jgi:hypothetical protein
MHEIEPHYNWRQLYVAEDDPLSPFYGREYSEFELSQVIYNHYIHPQWDGFGSNTLYMKIIFVDYERHFCVIELLGEWNDAIYNDVMYLYRNVVEDLIRNDIRYFILIGENVLEFHSDTSDYYEEWFDNLDSDGWIIGLNFREHVIREFTDSNIDYYLAFGGSFDEMAWRSLMPDQLFEKVEKLITKRLEA